MRISSLWVIIEQYELAESQGLTRGGDESLRRLLLKRMDSAAFLESLS